MKNLNSFLAVPFIALLCVLFTLASCESEIEPVPDPSNNSGIPNDPANPGNTVQLDPDQASEYLKLTDAIKISGDLPVASDGQLKINVKDTIFLVKDFPFGARMVVHHNGLHEIEGFYIGIPTSSFYYDVPKVTEEAQDSTDVFYFNVELPKEWESPFTFPITIIVYGPNGKLIDVFEKVASVEDPKNTGCSITVPVNYSLDSVDWQWSYSVNTDLDGWVLHLEAPGIKKSSIYKTGGCCNNDGTSTTVANDPYCHQNSLNFRPIDVSHYFLWAYDALYIYNNGTFRQTNLSFQTNYRPSLSDFCSNKPAYDTETNTFVKSGTHDFAPGADKIIFPYDVTNPPVYGKTVPSGELLYTCNSMIIGNKIEGQLWWAIYKRGKSRLTEISLGWD